MTAIFNPNIPLPADLPQDNQNEILNNFFTLNQDFGIDHQPFTTSTNHGYHTKLSFPNASSAPSLSTPNSSIYPLNVSGHVELLFLNNISSLLASQLTDLPIIQTSSGTGIKTPWGMIINFGQVSVPVLNPFSPETGTIEFPIPFTSNLYSIIGNIVYNKTPNSRLIISGSDLDKRTTSIINGGSGGTSSTSLPIYYIAIGV